MEETTTKDGMKVAVLGCGPAGMFLCHWIKTLMENNPSAKNVSVTCFEKSSRVGGTWKELDTEKEGENGMYDNLWTNGFCHSFEFPDYTFDEHFGKPVTVYMHRKDVLGYMLARVSRKSPDFFEKYVQFNTEVKNVTFNETTKKFSVAVLDLMTNTERTEKFDKCVWACGDCAYPYVPTGLKETFEEEGFEGKLMHAGQIKHLEQEVKDKRVLLVGGSASGEDLALQAVKCGAEHVYICSRSPSKSPSSFVNCVKHWPGDKVEVLKEQMVVGASSGGTVQFGKTIMEFGGEYSLANEEEISTQIENIDVVIFCTGYEGDFGNVTDCVDLPASFVPDEGFPLKFPDGHKVAPTKVDHLVGPVEPSDRVGDLFYDSELLNPEFYNGVSISNPNLMAVMCYDTFWPLLTIDLVANYLAGCIVGTVTVPSASEMRKRVLDQAVMLHGSAFLRFYTDRNFFNAIMAVEGFFEKEFRLWEECYMDTDLTLLSFLAGIAQEGNYPLSLGTPDKLSDAALAIHKMNRLSSYHREASHTGLMTFRDCDDSHKFHSVHTGTAAVPLEKKWVDM